MPTELRLTGDWQKLRATVDPHQFNERMTKNIAKATAFNGQIMVAEIRKRIRQRKYAANSALTIMIKNSSIPLINDGDLWGSITSKSADAFTVFVGLLRTAHDRHNNSLANIAEFLHQGGIITITEHMRNLFILLSEVGAGKRDKNTLEGRAKELAEALGNRIKRIKPLRPETQFIFVTPRPFLKDVLDDPNMHKKCEDNWRKAIQAALVAK